MNFFFFQITFFLFTGFFSDITRKTTFCFTFPRVHATNGAYINRSQAAARGLLPTQASHIWVSLHNVFRGEILERDSVRSLCRFPAVRSAAASLFIFMMFLGICEQIRSRTSKEKKSQKGKSKFPKVLSFFLSFVLWRVFFQGISSPSVLFREVNTTWTRCAPAWNLQPSLHQQPALSSR